MFSMIFAISFALNLGISVGYRRISRAGSIVLVEKRNSLIYTITTAIWGPSLYGIFIVYILFPDWLSWGSMTTSSLSWQWMGAILALGSVPLTFWSTRTLGRNLAGGLEVRLGHALVTRGPYRRIRHPLYLAAALFLVGESLLAFNLAVWVPCVAGIILMRFVVIPREEVTLTETFGRAFSRYRNRTGIWWPAPLHRKRHAVRSGERGVHEATS